MRLLTQKDRFARLSARFLLALFLSYYANITFFQHGHVVNGVTIVHSHIHQKDHQKLPSGGHTVAELSLIYTNSLFQTLAADLPHFDTSLFALFCLLQPVPPTEGIQAGSRHLFNLRAPPVC